MLLISIGLWCVVVFSSRVAFLGNPLYLHIVRTAPEALERLDELALAGASPTQQEDVEFMRRFMRLFWLELVLFLVEISLLVFLWWTAESLAWLSFALLFKNTLLLGLSAAVAKTQVREGLFENLILLPSWLVKLERISCLVSAAGCLVLFLHLNDLLLW